MTLQLPAPESQNPAADIKREEMRDPDKFCLSPRSFAIGIAIAGMYYTFNHFSIHIMVSSNFERSSLYILCYTDEK